MYFDPSFFQAEDRDGFHIKSMVKRCWAVQMDVLQQVDIICKRHNIMYYAECGTLLGAVRHQGFIPWDDDLDIGMRRVDYTRFLHYAKKELPEGYLVTNVHNHTNHTQLITRVLNCSQITTEPTHLNRFYGFPYVGGIDIFITDNIPMNKEEEEIQLNLLAAVNSLGLNWNNNYENDDLNSDIVRTEEEKMEIVRQIEELCNVRMNPNQSIKQQLLVLSDRICAMYWEDEPNEVSLLPDLFLNREFRFPIDCYKSTIEVPFEHMTIPIPVGYDYILKKRYGENYMTPVQTTSSHNYPFYGNQEQQLFEEYQKRNMEIPAYLKE